MPGLDPSRRTTALCLSGGGVRSACVAMGAMQILSEPAAPESSSKISTMSSRSPAEGTAGARLLAVQPEQPDKTSSFRLSDRFAPGSPEFDHLRRTSSYIADSTAKMIRALAEVIKNLIASLIILSRWPS